MLKRTLFFVATFAALPCFGVYNPKDISFELLLTRDRGYFPQAPEMLSTMTAVMRNVPLYFISGTNPHDYVKNVSFSLMKTIDGKYNLRYKILSSYKCEDMVLKGIDPATVEAALQNTFPSMLMSEADLTAGPDYTGYSVFNFESLYALRESEANQEHLLKCLEFINNFLPIDKLNFDEQDLYVPLPVEPAPAPEQATGWRSWFNWLRGQ